MKLSTTCGRLAWKLGVGLALLGLGAAAPPGAPFLTPPARPGERAPGLLYFRLKPETADTTFHLLVIPVRFPEDGAVGGGDLGARLLGTSPRTLQGYYETATQGRLHVVSTLAPVVTAAHSRAYYTVEGEGNRGYGLDPDAYPHNAQRLAEEATAAVQGAVDFRRYDNTGDRVVDGFLLLHSGPAAREAPPEGTPRTVLLPHAFTLREPAPRDDAWVFPYAVAATADSVGPWAHEIGHLLGFPDLYVSNAFGTSEGVGRWSLMATGALLGNGGMPAGLDAFTRQFLGVPAHTDRGVPIDLANGTFLRAFRPGEEGGTEYFLVERVIGPDTSATVIYIVNEAAGDNANPLRPLVAVRGVVCPGSAPCAVTLDDGTSPSLRDRSGNPTGLVLDITESSARVRHATLPPVDLERVTLDDPVGDAQRLGITVSSLDPIQTVTVRLDLGVEPGAPYVLRVDGDTAWTRTLAPLETVTDTRVRLAAANGPLPSGPVRVGFTWSLAGGGPVRTDSLTLVAGRFGLFQEELATFTPRALRGAARWVFGSGTWRVDPLTPGSDVELATPWFTVPPDGRLLLDHAWSLDAPYPDLALDAAHVRVVVQTGPDTALAPADPGWGYTADRGSGNALAGEDVLAGPGDRRHVLDLAAFARSTVRVVFRAAAWSLTAGSSAWAIRGARVTGAPTSTLGLAAAGADAVVVVGGPAPAGAIVEAWGGAGPVTPTTTLLSATWPLVSTEIPLDSLPPVERTVEIVWVEPSGNAGTSRLVVAPPLGGVRFLEPPYPNPVPRGAGQSWAFEVAEQETGTYRLFLVDIGGRLVAERSARFDVPGRRVVAWDGRDTTGRTVPAGVYVLACHGPGTLESRKVVVVP